MSIEVKEKQGVVFIIVEGSFDSSAYQTFKAAYEPYDGLKTHFVVDFKHANYIDSSALGMLLLLREKTAGDRLRLRLINATGEVASILHIAQFHQLFSINQP
jgi:anti-anti-sigma factor